MPLDEGESGLAQPGLGAIWEFEVELLWARRLGVRVGAPPVIAETLAVLPPCYVGL